MRIIREDWLVIAEDESSFPRLAFGDGPSEDYRPPRWPDPEHPQQLHLDIAVGDLEAGEELALRLGATRLQDKGEYRSYADPARHPFCLCRDTAGGEAGTPLPGRLDRVVFDCFSPRALAAFYEELLGMRTRKQDSPDCVVIAGDDGSAPMLAFQHRGEVQATTLAGPRVPTTAPPGSPCRGRRGRAGIGGAPGRDPPPGSGWELSGLRRSRRAPVLPLLAWSMNLELRPADPDASRRTDDPDSGAPPPDRHGRRGRVNRRSGTSQMTATAAYRA